MFKPSKFHWYKHDERSFDTLTAKQLARTISAWGYYDPVFDAVARMEEEDAEYWLGAAAYDSTAKHGYWDLADLFASQCIIRKRIKDNAYYARVSKAAGTKKRGKDPACSALDERRKKCTRPAIYVRRQQSKGGNWSYQRRCLICFEKVLEPGNYERIKTGRYFKD